ncbi:MAG: ATP-binding protein [Ignavibacteriae bacterium]|nr:ATP-binding protein [Ignavibacteriota bacterium]
MVKRQYWLSKIESFWHKRSIVWLSGVRRVGKTFLSKSIPEAEYFDCELPRVRSLLEDPQSFFEDHRKQRIVFDEIHRLHNPSQLLKIAADHFSDIKVLATGSSTLGASTRFKDTLTGRKTELWLTPLMLTDLHDFNKTNLKHRLLFGGLPPFFLSSTVPEQDFQEWMDGYWAKDIQELFRLERRYSFQKFVELLMAQSGGIFEATSFTRPCEVSRSTITNYLRVLELTFVVNILRPFTTRRATEIIAAPKVYGFDTGFVCYYRGWHDLRQEDLGQLWEHFVLNELHANLQSRQIYYWRDKRGHEIDFILAQRGSPPIAIECKWNSKEFEPTNLIAFERQYPKSKFFIVSNDVDHAYTKEVSGIKVKFVNLSELIRVCLNPREGLKIDRFVE